MTQVDIKYLEDKDGNPIAPITHVNAVRDSNGDTLPEILDRDYPTTSKTPVEGSSEVSLVTRGEKYDYDKVNNSTDVSGASGIGANLKYILLNGTTGEFEAALGSYVEEKVRSALGGLLHNLNKASVSSANLDVACIEHIPADANAGTPESYDFGSLSAAQLASVLGVHVFSDNVIRTSRSLCDAIAGTLIIINWGWNNYWIIASYNHDRFNYQVNSFPSTGDERVYLSVVDNKITVTSTANFYLSCVAIHPIT